MSACDSLVFYGTPFDNIEDNILSRKEAFEAKRLHGAFTGGFSAGYYNTVSSKEGWTPSSFISSRSHRAGKFEHVPEDFMDDEDFGEHGIAPRMIKVKKQFEQFTPPTTDDMIQAFLREVTSLKPSTAALNLMKKMGWREGQGIGPLMKYSEKHPEDKAKKVYGVTMPPGFVSNNERLEEVYVAPFDNPIESMKPKRDKHGLGYVGLSALSDTRKESQSHSKYLPRGQAFGVGLEEDEDDMDVYALDSMSKYDFFLDENQPSQEAKIITEGLPEFIEVDVLICNVKQNLPLLPPNYVPKPHISVYSPKQVSCTANLKSAVEASNNADPFVPRSSDTNASKVHEAKAHLPTIEWEQYAQKKAKATAFTKDIKDRFVKEHSEVAQEEEDPRVQAARNNLFGPLTRTEMNWTPERLLYKRFNIREPDENVKKTSDTKKAQILSYAEDAGKEHTAINRFSDISDACGNSNILRPEEEANEGELKITVQDDIASKLECWRKESHCEKPPLDLFKAIFEEDNDDDENEESEVQTRLDDNEKSVGEKRMFYGPIIPPSLMNSQSVSNGFESQILSSLELKRSKCETEDEEEYVEVSISSMPGPKVSKGDKKNLKQI